jgi:hypothetical protein
VKAISDKPKTCKSCRQKFVPTKPLQVACSISCALELARVAQAKRQAQEATKERVEHAKRKEATKTKGQHTKDAQIAFNAFIRERDRDLPCVSCGRHHQGQYHAGHYRTTAAAPELRFEPLNVWKQCAPCNNHKSGNLIEYRIELVKRIGVARVEWLEGPHEPKRYTVEDLKAIKAEYRAKLRELQRGGLDS